MWYVWDGESRGRRVWEDPFELEGLEGAGVLDFLQLHKGDPSTSFFHSHFFNFTLVSFPLFKFSICSFIKLSYSVSLTCKQISSYYPCNKTGHLEKHAFNAVLPVSVSNPATFKWIRIRDCCHSGFFTGGRGKF